MNRLRALADSSFREARARSRRGSRLRVGAICAAILLLSVAHAGEPALSAYKKLTLAQLMDIEVTSVSRRPQSLSEVASAVQVVTGDDIRRAGASQLPVALRLLPNLQVAQIDSRQWAIASRGFNNTTTNKLLVQMDGRTLYTPLYAGVFWDVQDTFLPDLDRIEVISGPGATQWGSNAVNGVINITTKSAKDTQGGLITASAGTEERLSGAARYGGTFGDRGYFRVYAKRSQFDSSALPSGASADDSWHSTQGGFRADWQNASDLLTFQGDAYVASINQPTAADIGVDGGNLLGRWTRTLGPKSELSVQSYFDYTHRDLPGSFGEHLAIYDFDVQHRVPLGEPHDFVWGGGYRFMNDRVANGPVIAFLPARVKREWFNGFVQDEMSLLEERLRLTLGAKVEDNPYTGAEFQPSARAAWRIRSRQILWLAVSRALRTPSRIDREFFAPSAPPFLLAGGPSFISEKLLAYELGFRTELQPGFTLSLSSFYHDYDDLRSLEPSAVPGGPLTIANGLKGRSYGAELAADYRVNESWRLRFGYTEQRVSSKARAGSRDQTSVRSQALDPERQLLLHSQVELPRSISLDLLGRYVARIDFQDVPAYFSFDLRVGWHPNDQLELALSGRNLLDGQHPEFGTPGARREIERCVSGSITWRF